MKMKLFAIAMATFMSMAVVGCGSGVDTGKPNSGVITKEVKRDGDGHLIEDTEKLPMTGQWCSELDVKYQRPGNNCLKD